MNALQFIRVLNVCFCSEYSYVEFISRGVRITSTFIIKSAFSAFYLKINLKKIWNQS